MNYPVNSQEDNPGQAQTAYMHAWWITLTFVGFVLGYTLISTLPHEVADEGFHGPQIWTFYTGQFSLVPQLTMPPTYHLIIAAMMRACGFYNVDVLRFFSSCIGILGVPLMYALVCQFWPKEAGMRAIQWLFMPIVFPFFFLIYTDSWAMLPLFGMLLLTLKRRHLLAALCGFLAICFRQTAVAWVGLAFLFTLLEDSTSANGTPSLRRTLYRVSPYLAVFSLFLAFVFLNKGIALGDRSQQAVHFNITNLYFFLITTCLLMLPYNLHQLPAILRYLKRPAVLVLVVLGLLFYLTTYSNTHQYNQPGLNVYLRNRLLQVMTESLAWRAAFYIPTVWTALSLLTTKWPDKRLHWILPIVAIFVCLHPMIDIRYYFPALAIILALRPPMKPAWELATVAFYLPLTAYLCFGIVQLRFFL